MGKLVLLIDDDKLPMRYYIKALRQKGFKVKQCFETDSALDFVENNSSHIDVIILDIMLPPGKRYEKKDTHEGLLTGLFLFEELREDSHCPHTPVVVLTNVRNLETLDKFKNKKGVKVVQKMNCPPFELVELVEKTLETWTKDNSHES